MNPDELFIQSKTNRQCPMANGLSTRAYRMACKNNIGNYENGIDKAKLLREHFI